jgi:GINS complex subunit 1
VHEVKTLHTDIENILAPFGSSFNPSSDPATATQLVVDHICMRRNKRCLLAYHRVRTDKLEEMVWRGVDAVERSQEIEGNGNAGGGPSMEGEGTGSALSPEEEEFARQYAELLAAYKGKWTDVDLTGSLEPPRDLFIDVRVLKDAGEIQTEYGYVNIILPLWC